MAMQTWPPSWWPFPLEFPWFVEQLIPYMDVLQFVHDAMEEIANAIPHQPPEHRRPVEGQVGAWANRNTKVWVRLGEVGYNAVTRQVIISLNREGGYGMKAQSMRLPVQSVLPLLFQLLIMIPWDTMGELQTLFGQNVEAADGSGKKLMQGSDKPPTAAQMVQWVFDKLREALVPLGIKLPALNGNYQTKTVIPDTKIIPSISDLVLYNIPMIDFCQIVYNAAMELVDTINHHPPAFVKEVYSGGVYVKVQYIVKDWTGATVLAQDRFPSLADLQGMTLVIEASFSDELGPGGSRRKRGTVVLLTHTFGGPSSTYFEFTSAENINDAEITEGMALPPIAGLNVKHSVAIAKIVQAGIEDKEVTNEDGSVTTVTGQPTIFLARLDIFADAASIKAGTEDVTPPLPSYTTVMRPISLTAIAFAEGETTLQIGDSIDIGVAGVTGAIFAIETTGAGEPEAEEGGGDPGSEPGGASAVAINLWNTTGDDITLADDISGFSAGGADFVFSLPLPAGLVLPKAGSITYSAAFADGSPTALSVAEYAAAEVSFSAPLVNLQTFVGWENADNLAYIGNEFSLAFKDNPRGAARYLQARLRYKKYDRLLKGEIAAAKQWTIRYTGDGNGGMDNGVKRVPMGVCRVARIMYNANERSVSLINAQNGENVKMPVNACIWFMLQLLMMLPFRVL